MPVPRDRASLLRMRRGAPRRVLGLLVVFLATAAACEERTEAEAEASEEAYGFAAHVEEAIALNTQRKPVYEDMTLGSSVELSELLISTEEVLLPTAAEYDERGAPFQAEGIPVVAADFVSMAGAGAVEAPPTLTGAWTDALGADLADALADLEKVDPGDFETVCSTAQVVLQRVDEMEATYGVHLAMTRHSVESVAFAALHAIDYADRSEGRTTELSRDLVELQLASIPFRLPEAFDERAAPIHALGAGILVNDVPPIPFLEEYAAAGYRR